MVVKFFSRIRKKISQNKMRAMVKKEGGGLEHRQVENPKVKDDQVLIKIIAAGVNICDMLLQTNIDSDWISWFDAAPKVNCPGHECSGIIIAIGTNVRQWRVGDKVCAILDGGGYAEQVVVSAKQLLPVPSTVSLADAASLPYAACNVWLALSNIQESLPGKNTLLINEATSAFGVIAIQVAKCKGFKVIATTGSREGMRLCHDLGADLSIDAKSGEAIGIVSKEITDHTLGVDVILDYGSSYIQKLHRSIARWGTRLIVDLEGEAKCSASLAEILLMNLQLQVINLRIQSKDEKASIIAQVRKNIWPAIEEGKVKPVISHRLPLTAAPLARQLLNNHDKFVYGNILLYP